MTQTLQKHQRKAKHYKCQCLLVILNNLKNNHLKLKKILKKNYNKEEIKRKDSSL
jgi:hypothetical protein